MALRSHVDRFTWNDGLRWGVAGLVVIAVHVGTAVWAMRTSPPPAAEEAAPAAIMIELAPAPVAPEASEQEIATPQAESQASSDPVEPTEFAQEDSTAEKVAEAEEVPEPVEQPQPEEQAEPVEKEAEEPVETELNEPELDDVKVPLPVARPAHTPRKVEKPKPEKKTARKPQPKKAPSQAAVKAKVRAEQAPVAAARQSSRGSVSSVSPARWQSRLLAHLERNKRYPSGARSRREQGTAYVRFRIDANGRVLSASLARSSGSAELDREVVAMVRRASPVPAPPPGVKRTITVPVRFRLR